MSFTTSCVCALLLVTLLDRVELSSRTFTATEGGNARLSCSYTRKEPPLPSDFSVIWKDPRGKALSNSKNNFILDLSNVTQNQSGIYECHIPELFFQTNVYLNVTGKVGRSKMDLPKGDAAGSHFPVCFVMVLFPYLVLFH